ncbi:MAG: helix-turn-helix domain-containing protein [Halopenitus sp.]
MTCARFRLDIPAGQWVGDVSREFDAAEFTVRANVPGEESGHALVAISAADLDAVLDAMAAHPALETVVELQRGDGEVTVQVETSRPTLLRAARRSGLPIEPPICISEGYATIDVEGDHSRLSELVRELEALDVGVEVVFIGRGPYADTLLTDTQEELLTAAIEEGYYDNPRGCTLTEIADKQDIAKSTCSEILQRAEEAVMKQFMGDTPDAPVVAQ